MRSFALGTGLFLLTHVALAHGGDGAHAQTQGEAATPAAASADPTLQSLMQDINAAYEAEIKPIFVEKCFDCHSDQPRHPWYYSIPGVRHLIDYDIREARKHLDFSPGFPFKGHGDPADDLEEIKEVVEDGSMPPFIYRLGHWSSALTEAEKAKILAWVEDSLRRLNAPRPE